MMSRFSHVAAQIVFDFLSILNTLSTYVFAFVLYSLLSTITVLLHKSSHLMLSFIVKKSHFRKFK